MAHRLPGSALAGLIGVGMLAFEASPAQTPPVPETPVIIQLSEAHATATTWTLIQSLEPVVPNVPSFFGQTVAASGEHLAVGSRTQIQLYEKRKGQWTGRVWRSRIIPSSWARPVRTATSTASLPPRGASPTFSGNHTGSGRRPRNFDPPLAASKGSMDSGH